MATRSNGSWADATFPYATKLSAPSPGPPLDPQRVLWAGEVTELGPTHSASKICSGSVHLMLMPQQNNRFQLNVTQSIQNYIYIASMNHQFHLGCEFDTLQNYGLQSDLTQSQSF